MVIVYFRELPSALLCIGSFGFGWDEREKVRHALIRPVPGRTEFLVSGFEEGMFSHIATDQHHRRV